MKIYQNISIKDFFESVPIAIKVHTKDIFSDFEKHTTIAEAVGGPIYVVEKKEDLDKVIFMHENYLGRIPYKLGENLAIEYAEWTAKGEYLFIVDVIMSNGAASYFIPKELVDERLLQIYEENK